MFRRLPSAIFLMVMVALAPVVRADVPTTPSTAVPTDLSQANLSPDAGLVSLDFQDADIRNVLKVLAFKSGVNIVAGPEVTGVVSIELKDVPWQKALDVILSTYGYGFDRKGNIITVMSVESLKKYREDALALENQESLAFKTFPLNYGKAEDVMKVIDKLVSKRGFINFDERTNSIIVRDLESNLELISGVIKSIDTVTPQVSIEVKIIETQLKDNESLGIDWTSKGSLPTPKRTTAITANSAAFSIDNSPLFTAPSALGAFTYTTINGTELQAVLTALTTRENTKTLSNPRIVTLDNQKATINIGLEYPEATYSFNASTGQAQVTGFTQLPIGVNFEVTPHVNNAGMVTLDLHPQISALLKTLVQVNGYDLPETSNQEAKTNVMVEDGKTLVIGGLITDTTDTVVNKIPVLGDIPWLGNFFKSAKALCSLLKLPMHNNQYLPFSIKNGLNPRAFRLNAS